MMMAVAGRTIEQVAEDLADRHDLVPASALRLARVFQKQAARADGVEADEAHVTASQEQAIADGELRTAMTRAADDGMSVGRLAELTGLDRSDVLAMLGEGQAR